MIGRSPIVNRMIGAACYIFGLIIMVVNIYYSQRYFHYLIAGSEEATIDGLMWISTWAIAGGMGAYEAVCIGLLTTPIAWSFMFNMPARLERIQNHNQRQFAHWVIIASLILGIAACIAVYVVDFSTTLGGLTAYRPPEEVEQVRSGFVFLTLGLVFGSEIMFVGGNITLWMALIGQAQTARTKKTMQTEIEEVHGGASGTAHFNGSAHAPVRGAANGRRRGLNLD